MDMKTLDGPAQARSRPRRRARRRGAGKCMAMVKGRLVGMGNKNEKVQYRSSSRELPHALWFESAAASG